MIKTKSVAPLSVIAIALAALVSSAGCNPYKMIVGVVVDVVELAEDVVWFGIAVDKAIHDDTGIVRIEHAQDGDLSVVRGYNAQGDVVLDSALSIPQSERETGCASASPSTRFDAALSDYLHCDTSRAACSDERLELHLAAQEIERCAH